MSRGGAEGGGGGAIVGSASLTLVSVDSTVVATSPGCSRSLPRARAVDPSPRRRVAVVRLRAVVVSAASSAFARRAGFFSLCLRVLFFGVDFLRGKADPFLV